MENDSLTTLLAAWRVTPSPDPQFRARVRARIETGRPSSWPGFARAHPTALAASLGLALVLGGWFGREQARARGEAESGRLATAYVKALDARTMTPP